jgi:hypothetical protein
MREGGGGAASGGEKKTEKESTHSTDFAVPLLICL